MDDSTSKPPGELPQSKNVWCFACRQVRTWLKDDDGELVRPWVLFTMDMTTGLLLNIQISITPSAQEAMEVIYTSMLHPVKGFNINAQRPGQIHFEDRQLVADLKDELAEIDVVVKYRSHTEILNQVVRELEIGMRKGEPEMPGLLSKRKVTPIIVSGLFSAAAEFYRQDPWIKLSNHDVLAIKLPTDRNFTYAIVMGQGGVEYGLSIYDNWKALERIHAPYDDVMEVIPEEGAYSITNGEIYDLPFDDIDAIERYGWEVADAQAYPLPMIILPSGELERPSRDKVLWTEAALRAIPIFAQENLEIDQEGNLLPAEARVSVVTAAGRTMVEINYPVEGIPEDWGVRPRMDEWDPNELERLPPPPDRRAI